MAEVIIGDDEFNLGLTDDYAFGKLKLPNGRHMLYTAQPKAVPLTELQRLTPEEAGAVFRKWWGVPTTNHSALIMATESALAAKNGMELRER